MINYPDGRKNASIKKRPIKHKRRHKYGQRNFGQSSRAEQRN